ncbi:hypothetical protein [Limnohabitans sp.]|uniref:hypothetical protein n=1 Tax=Limnohabitans sp. TaxID=1907725 RepID=UPI00286F8D95|nr:hypothetical protein [Limnohabitans sp.]
MKGFGHWGEASTAAWLCLRDEGGWWTVEELENELQCFSRSELRRSLKNLAHRQHLRHRVLKNRVVYGLTLSCTPIQGHVLNPQLSLFSDARKFIQCTDRGISIQRS